VKCYSIRIKAIALFSLSALALTGCASDSSSMAPNHNGMMGGNSSAAKFSGADIMFAQMMIPHHQQAVDMGTLAETRALSPEVKALAAQIKSEQAPEIAQMKSWLKDAGATLDMGHSMGMGGMLNAADMKALAAASGSEFDRLFLEGMIGHHDGAIHMAQMVIDSNNDEANALGHAIVTSQTKQIAYMKQLLIDLNL
jgi:uncharacterized protein (DUF305 family)